ncbi:hypothetical protein AWZ03_013341 [Drosophila navojoa]|uniref:Uncharacterized protein n=1 Tax=Drosophila navojoa TaxID=7232 RepID=A0A484AX97_DRONA|nr:hypothetical protein AWZ03_013341 [Drosophila navojoa]
MTTAAGSRSSRSSISSNSSSRRRAGLISSCPIFLSAIIIIVIIIITSRSHSSSMHVVGSIIIVSGYPGPADASDSANPEIEMDLFYSPSAYLPMVLMMESIKVCFANFNRNIWANALKMRCSTI